MFFILSDILPTHCPFPICHGIWHCRGMVILSTDFHRFMECGGVFRIVVFVPLRYYPIVGSYPLIVRFIPPQILYSHCGVKPSGLCVNFSTHSPLCHGIVGTRKPSPRTFIGQWVGGAYHTLCIVGYGGMSDCRHCVLFVCLHYYYTRWWGKIQ